MDHKRRLGVAIAITLLIAAAIFASFGRNLFSPNPPAVVLPNLESDSSNASSQTDGSSTTLAWINVTPETVQNVIESLNRADSYYREQYSELFWPDSSATFSANIFVDRTWMRIDLTHPTGIVRHELIGSETAYYWYEGSTAWRSEPAEGYSSDLAQRSPTYETILALNPSSILTARYEQYHNFSCIYVEVFDDALGYTERYWVDVSSGLLIFAETEKDDTVVYRMTTTNLQMPCPFTIPLDLPDGTLAQSSSD